MKRKTITYNWQCTLIPRFAVSAGLGDSLRFEKINNKIMNSFYLLKLLGISFISSFFLLKLFHAVYSAILICTSSSYRFCRTVTVILYRDTSTKILIVCVCRLSCSVFSCSVRFCDVTCCFCLAMAGCLLMWLGCGEMTRFIKLWFSGYSYVFICTVF